MCGRYMFDMICQGAVGFEFERDSNACNSNQWKLTRQKVSQFENGRQQDTHKK